MDRTKALAKIKKCLALSRSANAHEAGVALRQAQALMRDFAIDETDLQLSDVHEHGRRCPCVATNLWEVELGNMVAEAFGCATFSVIDHKLIGTEFRKRRDRLFVGVGASAEVACYAYDVLARQLVVARLRHISLQRRCKPVTKTARGDEYARGWVLGAQRVVDRLAGNAKQQALIEQYLQRAHPGLRKVDARNSAVGRNVRVDDAANGIIDGRNARLDRGLGQASGSALLSAGQD